jgi:hypothetical protein
VTDQTRYLDAADAVASDAKRLAELKTLQHAHAESNLSIVIGKSRTLLPVA